MTTQRFALFTPTVVRLRTGGAIEVENAPRRAGEQDGWVVGSLHAESDHDVHADHWEIHPFGQEVVSVLAGRARLVLRAEADRAEESINLPAGTACLVPRNRWHRLEVDGPTDLQVITPRQGTRLEARA